MFTIARGQGLRWGQSNGDEDGDRDKCCGNGVGMGTGIAGMETNTAGMKTNNCLRAAL